jgi:hypothetical protein
MTTGSNLLRIDADAAARKLSEKRFRTKTESIVALIRLAASTSPEAIHISITRGRVEIVTRGGMTDGAVFRYAAALFDPGAHESVRIEAMKRLESHSGASFLAAFSETFTRVSVHWRDGGKARGIEFSRHKVPKIVTADFQDAFRLIVEGKLGAVSRATAVAAACRFSTVQTYVNGRRVDRGRKLPGCLTQTAFEANGLFGVIGIPEEGVLSCLIRLENGIVVSETFYGERRGMVLDALVENAEDDADGKEVLDRLRDRGRMLYSRLADKYHSFSENRRRFAKERLMSRYEHSFERNLVANLHFFSCADGRWVDLFEIKRLSHLEKVYVVDKDVDMHAYRTRNRPVLRLDAREKKFLRLTLGATFDAPPLRVSVGSHGFIIRKTLRRIADWIRLPSIAINDVATTEEEQHFEAGLRAHLGDGDQIIFCNGRHLLPVKRTAAGYIVRVPRQHPRMPEMTTATADPDGAAWTLRYLTRGVLPASTD